MARYDIPAGVPALLKRDEVARVLRLKERSVKTFLDCGALPSTPTPGQQRGARWVKPEDVLAFAVTMGITPDWYAAL